MKWSSEALVAAGGFLLSTVANITASGVHWGQEQEQLAQTQTTLAAHDGRLAELEKGINETKTHEAVVEQKLSDMVDSLHNIEKHMK
jgi:septal ring factor EnvC (AmiA/AmiB activator)